MIPILLVTVIVAVAQGGANLSRLQVFRTLNQVNVGPQNSGSRILGGKLCPECEWMVSVTIPGDEHFFCAGSIIRQLWVVTAAKCFNSTTTPKNLNIRIGPLSSGQLYKAKKIIIHERYRFLLEYDIALIWLSQPTPANILIRPLTLVKEPLGEGSKLYVSGRGKNEASSTTFAEQYMHAELELVKCKRHHTQSEYVMCTSTVEKNLCNGDSGMPLYNADTLELVGVLSEVRPKDCTGYGLFTNVFHFSDWIESKIRISEQNEDPGTTYKPNTTTTPTTLTTPWKPITPVGSASSYYRPVLVCWLVTLLHPLHLFYIRWC